MKKFVPKEPIKNLKTLLKVLEGYGTFLHTVGTNCAFVYTLGFKFEGEERSEYAGCGLYEWRGAVEWPIRTARQAIDKKLVVETFKDGVVHVYALREKGRP